jgi:DNA repair protein RecN (Recombination protein N)
MLKTISISNIVLIQSAEIDFSLKDTGSLLILTGETGSGKSILLDALGLAIGFRSNIKLIGSYSNKAQVAAEFDISKNEKCKEILRENDLLDDENSLKIRRVLQENSGNKAYINDKIVGINLLAKIGETLVEIHGQNDQRGLLNSSQHLTILDGFSQNYELLIKINKIYYNLIECNKIINSLQQKKEQNERQKDYLIYTLQELDNAAIMDGEECDLIEKKDKFLGKEKILNFLNDLKIKLIEANSQLYLSQKTLIKNQNIVNSYLSENKSEIEKLSEKIDEQNIFLDSEIDKINALDKSLKSDKSTLEDVEERLFFIRGLARKFNTKTGELKSIIESSKKELSLLKNEEITFENLLNEKNNLLAEYKKIADELTIRRKKYALILSKKIEEELKFLKMENVKFNVEIFSDRNYDEPYSNKGFDKIKFLASTNRNSFDEIAKIASGGELSRFMLALKVALMEVKSSPIMIFDEIDSGVGGATADAVGRRLKVLSKNLQIFVVTHQAQIAAKADVHFQISKITEEEKIKTVIKKLSKQEVISEVARMISGEKITYEALEAAKTMIKIQ